VLVRAGRRPKCTRNRGTGQRSTLLPARGGRSFTRASDSDAIRRPKSKSDSNRTPAASDRVCLPAHVREVSLAATPRHRQGCARQRLHRRYSLSLSLALLSWIKYVHSSARYAVFPWIARIPCSRSSRDLRSGRRRNVCGTKSVYLHRNRARILELTGLTVSDTASCNILVFNSSILHRKRERERERGFASPCPVSYRRRDFPLSRNLLRALLRNSTSRFFYRGARCGSSKKRFNTLEQTPERNRDGGHRQGGFKNRVP
jgi:hypothetical protein